MRALLDIILLILQIYIWLLIASAVLSWLIAFNVVNTRNQVVAMVGDFLYRITEPVLAADPFNDAQSRRHRRLAGDPDPDHPASRKRNHPVHLSQRVLTDGGHALVATPGGVVLAVRLTPKGGRDAIDGVETLGDGRPVLNARVRARRPKERPMKRSSA